MRTSIAGHSVTDNIGNNKSERSSYVYLFKIFVSFLLDLLNINLFCVKIKINKIYVSKISFFHAII